MTETRPPLTDKLSGDELLRWYWTRAELTGLARTVGISTVGGKQELTARLAAHLDGAAVPAPAVRRTPAALALVEPLTGTTVIPAGQRCTQQLRAYLSREIGPAFRFDAAMRDFIADGAGQTLDDAVVHWHQTRSAPRPEIGAHFELNRFLRDWYRDHPEGQRREALLAWQDHRARPVDERGAPVLSG